jgi:hypothetical protein
MDQDINKNLIKILFDKDENGLSISDLFEKSRISYDNEAEEYWERISYEDKLKAFYCVCKRVHKGDVVEKGSYRYVLYEVFGFNFDAYVVGMNCGYMDIHNSIYSKDEIPNLKNYLKDNNGHQSSPNGGSFPSP